MSTLRQELSTMNIEDQEDLLDTMTEIINTLCEKFEKQNRNWVYCLETIKKIATVKVNIEMVKNSINLIIK